MFSAILRNNIHRFLKNRCNHMSSEASRNSWYPNDGWHYRKPIGDFARWDKIVSYGLNGIMWWWILVHVYYDFEHLIGVRYPSPKRWSNKHLGIPESIPPEAYNAP